MTKLNPNEGYTSPLAYAASASTVRNRVKSDQMPTDLHNAIHWLSRRGGDGALFKDGRTVLASGIQNRYGVTVWPKLTEKGYVTTERGRVTITEDGRKYILTHPLDLRDIETIHNGRVDPHLERDPEDF